MSVKRRDRAYPVSSEDPSYVNGYSAATTYAESPVIPSSNSFAQRPPGSSGSNMAGPARQPTVHRRRESNNSNSHNYPQATYASPNTSQSARRVVSDPRPTEIRLTKRNSEKRDGISHQSPLQQLEKTLSKEERRARLEEAESLARERSTRKSSGGTYDSSREKRRSVSGPADRSSIPPPPIGANRDAKARADGPTRGADYYSNTPPFASAARGELRPAVPPKEPLVKEDRKGPVNTTGPYGPMAQDSYPTRSRADPSERNSAQFDRRAVSAGTGLAVAGLGHERTRSTSNKLQKNPPTDKRGSGYWDSPITDYARRDPSNGISPATAKSVYHTPPQHASPTEQRGLGIEGSRAQPTTSQSDPRASGQSQPARQSQHGFHLPHVFHRRDRQERRYQAAPVVSDWKSVKTAKLSSDDLDLMVAPESATSEQQAWWERSQAEKRRGSASASSASAPKTLHYDANFDERSGQTYFKPPIYLKCGPLLRFRGIYKEAARSARSTTTSATKEVWKGSIMIVTIDRKSSYEKPPVLRLFKQPVELLPPPPAEIDMVDGQALSPDYDDPVAGTLKMSRVGKTLYVRPVEDLPNGVDLSRKENDKGLFEEKRSGTAHKRKDGTRTPVIDGEQVGKIKEVQGARLFAERGVTFWKFNVEIELGAQQQRIGYRINRGPAVGFWVPAANENMNIMFHSCNGFSISVDANSFSGPDPLWRDVLNTHQTRPFHVMLGGGDQIYMDSATVQTKLFSQWALDRNPLHKRHAEFTVEMQDELEQFYLDRYAMWFSQGLFGMANSQIPMVNIWDDHDIMDGFGSYSHGTMESPVIMGVGAVAFKYYMLFQHQTVPDETEVEEPSWILGAPLGPYINQKSRSVFMALGKSTALLGLDCRTERMKDEILSDDTWENVFDRLEKDVIKNEHKHLIVMLGVPIAYPRLNFLETVLTSRLMDPIKALGRTGALGGFVNKFDGGVEILDDLDDHWTAKHHKDERNWFVQELQHMAAKKSVRVTILGGDVHLAAIGQFYSHKKLHIPKDRDHRYMPNIISSAIVNTPPGDMLADVLNKRNKVHYLDDYTAEDMVPMFFNDVDGKPRNNKHLLPRRNWCSIRDYEPKDTPHHSAESTPRVAPANRDSQPPTPYSLDDDNSSQRQGRPGTSGSTSGSIRRSLSLTRRKITDKLTGRSDRSKPPVAFYTRGGERPVQHQRSSSADAVLRSSGQPLETGPSYFPSNASDTHQGRRSFSTDGAQSFVRPNAFVRRPTDLSEKQREMDPDREGHINLEHGLDICLNVENVKGEPEGTTTDYRLIVPALDFHGEIPELPEPKRLKRGRLSTIFTNMGANKKRGGSTGGDSASISGSEHNDYRARARAASNNTHDQFPDQQHADDGIDRSGTPLGGWVDQDVNPSTLHHSQQPQAITTSSRKPVPPPTSNIPEKAPSSSLEVPRSRNRGLAAIDTSGAPTRVAADGRPVRTQYRGAYDDDLLENSVSSVGTAEEAEEPYGHGPGTWGRRGREIAQQQHQQGGARRGQRGGYDDDVAGEQYRGGRGKKYGGGYGEEPESFAEPGSPSRQGKGDFGKRRASWKFWKVGF